MQKFIRTHIREKITLRMLANEAGYSPWHSARVFKELTGKTPFDYIRSLRLSRAAERLSDGKTRVVDVAFEFMFDSHEGFTRAFSRQFGVSPKRFLKEGTGKGYFIPYTARNYYLKTLRGDTKMTETNGAYTVFVQVVDRPKRKFICLPGKKATQYFEYCDEVGCEIWDILTEVKDALYEPIGAWMPESLRIPGTSEYLQGVEMAEDYNGPVPEGCVVMELSPCKLLVFQGPPYDDEKFQEAIGDFWTKIEGYNPEIYGFRWAEEDGPRFQLCPEGWRGYIEAKPVRQINL